MATNDELQRLERALLAAEDALNRARAENRLSPVHSSSSSDIRWAALVRQAEQAGGPGPKTFVQATPEMIIRSAAIARGEVVPLPKKDKQK
jgi:hypothetical protein